MNYDAVILSSEKDYIKLDFLLDSLINLDPKPENIFVISPTEIKEKRKEVNYFLDDEVLKFKKENLKFRPNWIKQQFLKLFQDITKNDYYLILDSDIFLNKKIEIFKNNKPNFLLSVDQNHKPYFDFLENFGIKKIYERSFISEIMLFNKKIIRRFLEDSNLTVDSFINKSIEIINDNCYISEFEFYGNMVLKYYPDLYDFTILNTRVIGKHEDWNKNEILQTINNNQDLDIISYHTWK
jgi:hypothetical protein